MRINNIVKFVRKIDNYVDNKISAGEKLPCGKLGMRIRAILSFFAYGTSFSEYFGYSFYKKTRKEKLTYMTRRYMFKFFDKYNPLEYRDRIGDKSKTAKYYGKFMNREQFIYTQGREAFDQFCKKYPMVFVKKAVGWGGEGARIEDVSTEDKRNAVWKGLSTDWIAEPVVENCMELKKLHPKSLNTLKVVTLIVQGKPEIATAILRIGNNTVVDNVHLGGMAAGICIESGKVVTEAVDNKFRRYAVHPITREQITGIIIPQWEKVKEIALEAAMITPQLRYASWDIAITDKAPVIMEGNWDAEFYAEQELFECGNRTKFVELLERK